MIYIACITSLPITKTKKDHLYKFKHKREFLLILGHFLTLKGI